MTPNEASYTQRTLAKAQKFIREGGKLSLDALDPGLWEVTGFSGVTYQIRVTDEGGSCSCHYGEYTHPSRCYHACAVDLVLTHIQKKREADATRTGEGQHDDQQAPFRPGR